MFDGDNVNGQVDGDYKLCCYICVSIYTYIYIYIYIYLFIYLYTLCQQLVIRVLGVFKIN